ncbi:hypothetical protein LUU34_00826200 [Aix galericulata]|nr:hypothetical protein LUU34_00826200 [Aix galericulata]
MATDAGGRAEMSLGAASFMAPLHAGLASEESECNAQARPRAAALGRAEKREVLGRVVNGDTSIPRSFAFSHLQEGQFSWLTNATSPLRAQQSLFFTGTPTLAVTTGTPQIPHKPAPFEHGVKVGTFLSTLADVEQAGFLPGCLAMPSRCCSRKQRCASHSEVA